MDGKMLNHLRRKMTQRRIQMASLRKIFSTCSLQMIAVDSSMVCTSMLYTLTKYYTRSQVRQPVMSGLDWVERKLTNRNSCYNMFRMTPTVFYWLHDTLVEQYVLKSSRKSTSIEALGMFLWMVGAPQSVRQAEDKFERSLGTVHNMFFKVLNCS